MSESDKPFGLACNEGLGARFDAWMLTPATTTDIYGPTEERMRAAWNAAITAAADRCEELCHKYQKHRFSVAGDEVADACKDEVRKLYSAPNVRGKPPQVGLGE